MAFLPLLEWRGNKMIEFRQVSKRYPNGFEALKNVSLTIGQGEFVAIIGLSGAGKSTLIRTINRMHDITEGMLTVDGTDVMGLHGKSLRAFRRRIGMIFQSFNLITRTTVIKNVLTAFVPDLPWWRAAFGIFTKEKRSRPWRRWTKLASWTKRLSGQISSPEDSSSAWRSRVPWLRIHRSFWQTSRWPRWTR